MVTIAVLFKVSLVTKSIANLVELIVSTIINMFNTQKFVQEMSFNILLLGTFITFNNMDIKVGNNEDISEFFNFSKLH